MAEEQKPAAPAAAAPAQKEYVPVQEEKTMALLSYIGLLFLIPMLARKDSKFAQFHAKQGMVLFGLDIALWIVVWIINMILFSSWYFIGFWGISTLVSLAAWAIILVLSIMGIVNASGGKWWKMPMGLGQLAASFKF